MAKLIDLRTHVKPEKKPKPVDASDLLLLLSETPVRKSPTKKGRSKSSKKRKKRKAASSIRLRVHDRRRSEVFEKKDCFECHAQVSHSFLYRNTNISGVKVYLCVMCEAIVLERSFGKTDAMEKAILVGQVESNRRRH